MWNKKWLLSNLLALTLLICNSSAIAQVEWGDSLERYSAVFGRVFYDANGDGEYQDGEAGVGGVKLVSVQGDVVTTDQEGRYHLVLANTYFNGNFILKLDTKSLPEGYKVTTENPAIVRMSAGMTSQIDFGVVDEVELANTKAQEKAAKEAKKAESGKK